MRRHLHFRLPLHPEHAAGFSSQTNFATTNSTVNGTARAARIVGCLWCLLLLAPASPARAESPALARVLVLHHYGQEVPFRASFDPALQEALRTFSPGPMDLYVEAIESYRFPDAAQSGLVRDYLKAKYASRNLDVVIAVTDTALAFVRQNPDVFPGVPTVALVTRASLHAGEADVTGLQMELGIRDTLNLALRLDPAIVRVFVVDGVLHNTGDIEAEVRRQVEGLERPLELVYLRDLPLADLIARIKAIPERSIVFFVRQAMWDRATTLDSREGLAQVVRASPVPIYTFTTEQFGMGPVGGFLWQVKADATRLADMAIKIANGARPRDIRPAHTTVAATVDWRQLQRWRIPEARLPAGTSVLFRPQTFLEQYRQYVLGGLLVFAVQLALIVGLLVQRWRRRRAEEEMQQSEARYRSVVDTQSELICRFLPDSTLTFVNDAYCRFWNKTREELLGRRFVELIPESSREAVLDLFGHLPDGIDSHEHPVTMADGTIGWQHWIIRAIVDERGQLIELQGVGRDITDRKRAEEVAGQLEARNSAILRAIPDLMFVLLRDGTYVDYHARDPKLLLVPPDQLIGRTIPEIMPPGVADTLMDALGRAYFSAEPVVVEYELALGEPRYFEARLVYAEHDCVLSIVRDVTESKRALALNRDLAGRLIASQEVERTRIARDLHDGICQDVAAVSVDVSCLRRHGGDVQSPVVQEMLVSVERRTASVAENLRLLSHGLHPSVLQHIGLVPALQAHCAEVERQHQLQVTFFAEGDVEPASRLVALSLFRIAQEALRNAARHGHARNATVSLVRTDNGLSMAIADDGVGFDPVAAHQKDGLGLVSIVERARLMGGHVTIDSEPGSGTTLDVRVPLQVLDDAPPRRRQSDTIRRRSGPTARLRRE